MLFEEKLDLSSVIASAAKQSRVAGGTLDCFADARNDVVATKRAH
jgi:hypothetical protein